MSKRSSVSRKGIAALARGGTGSLGDVAWADRNGNYGYLAKPERRPPPPPKPVTIRHFSWERPE